MANNVITDINSTTKVFKSIDLSSMFLAVGYTGGMYLFFSSYVYPPYVLWYMLFSLGCGIFLALPSSANKGRKNWQSIVLMFQKDGKVYSPIYDFKAYNQLKTAKTGKNLEKKTKDKRKDL